MPTAPKWINDAVEKMVPSMMRTVKVENTVYLNPAIKRVCLKGNFSGLSFDPGYTISFRVNATDSRHYTVSYTNPSEGIIEFIAHIHGDAVGANYIAGLEPGNEEIKLTVLGSDRHYNPYVQKQLVFGDETSLGLMSGFLPLLKKNNHQFKFFVELDDDNRNIPSILGLENCTGFSKHDVFRDREKISELSIFKNEDWSGANVILTGNVTSIQNFKKVLKANNHRGKIYVKGYWLEGKKGL